MLEKFKFIVNVELALVKDKKILVIQRPEGVHGGGLYALPGGKAEFEDGERNMLTNAAKREMREEVGIEVCDPMSYVTTSCFVIKGDLQIANSVFVSFADKTKIEVSPSPREVKSWAWLSRDEIDRSELSPEWLKYYVGLIADMAEGRL